MSNAPYRRRSHACRERLGAVGADALVLSPGPTMRYLTGFAETVRERHLLFVLPRAGAPVFVAPAMYGSQLRAETWVTDVRTYADGDDPLEPVRAVASEHGLHGTHLLLDPTMPARFTLDVQRVLPDATFGLSEEAVAPLRARKGETELAALREASAVADGVSEALRERGRDLLGTTERELARTIARLLEERGGEDLAFETCVAAGPNGAHPHHAPGDREIRAGDPVVLDFGTRVRGYPSDQTRTVVFGGDPPEGFVDAFDAVRDARRAAVDAVEPGVPAEAVDGAARSVVEERGYGEQFLHRTGHGVGLEIHEPPYIVAGNETRLEPGMVFSVEPGIYVEGEFGVRVEDLVAVTGDGREVLNDSPRGWRA